MSKFQVDPKISFPILHLGLGQFHRAHQCVYFQKSLSKTQKISSWTWQSPPPESAHLFDVAELSNTKVNIVEIDVIGEIGVASKSPAEFINRFANKGTRLFTLTITEKSYFLENSLDTALSLLLAALVERRRLNEKAPLTILSCDNLHHNSTTLKKSLLQLAQRNIIQDLEAFINWFESQVEFLNSMVDRIAPKFSESQIDQQIIDLKLAPNSSFVFTEFYKEWVIEKPQLFSIEDLFTSEVLWCDSIDSAEERKLHILNASHSYLAYAGLLKGHSFVHEAFQDKMIYKNWRELVIDELLPYVQRNESEFPENYLNDLEARFSNKKLPHSLLQIASDGSVKLLMRFEKVLAWHKAHSSPVQALSQVYTNWHLCLLENLKGSKEFKFSDPLLSKVPNNCIDLSALKNFIGQTHPSLLGV